MITSVNNQTIKEISLLLKKGKERKKQDIFVAEGIRMFTEIPKKQMIKAFVSESFLQTKEDRVLDGIDYEVVSDSVFKEISDTKTPQGILALVKQFHYTIEEILEKKLSGVYRHKVMNRKEPLVRGFDDFFMAPHSRYTQASREDILNNHDL